MQGFVSRSIQMIPPLGGIAGELRAARQAALVDQAEIHQLAQNSFQASFLTAA